MYITEQFQNTVVVQVEDTGYKIEFLPGVKLELYGLMHYSFGDYFSVGIRREDSSGTETYLKNPEQTFEEYLDYGFSRGKMISSWSKAG